MQIKEGEKCKVTFSGEVEPEIMTYVGDERGFYVFRNDSGAKVVARKSSLSNLEKAQ